MQRVFCLKKPSFSAGRDPFIYSACLSTMSAIVAAFKIKEFDLEPVYASWKNPPTFYGIPTKDPSVDYWLAEIKAGCMERKVPKEYWHKVAQHNLGPQAKGRFDELKVVLAKIHGGKYRWNWKRFKVAMRNMGCMCSLSYMYRYRC
jgi:hypothetical protein